MLGKVAEAVLGGLSYLYVHHRVMHRDIRPSKILVNRHGHVKLSDLGPSTNLSSSYASSIVGSAHYQSPERIQMQPYTVKSDVWSFGLTLFEIAVAIYPYDLNTRNNKLTDDSIGVYLDKIVTEPAPTLPKSDAFPSILYELIEKCLRKDPDKRPYPQDLNVFHPCTLLHCTYEANSNLIG